MREAARGRQYSFDEDFEDQDQDRRQNFENRSEYSDQEEIATPYHLEHRNRFHNEIEYSSTERHDRNRRIGASKVDVGQQGTTPKVVWTYKKQAASPIYQDRGVPNAETFGNHDDFNGSVGSSDETANERMRGDLYWQHSNEWVPGHFVLDNGRLARYPTAVSYTQQRPPLESIALLDCSVNPIRINLRSSNAPPPGFEHVLAIEAADGDSCLICFRSGAQQDRWLRAIRVAAAGRYDRLESAPWPPSSGGHERGASDSERAPSRSRSPSMPTASGPQRS